MSDQSVTKTDVQAPSANEVAAREIATSLEGRYQSDYASFYNALGALAGFGCQMAVREGFIKPGLIPAHQALQAMQGNDGRTYYFGDFLNEPMYSVAPGRMSVWTLVAGAAMAVGAKNLLSVEELIGRTNLTVGTKDFGIPNVPQEFQADQLPIDVVIDDWPDMQRYFSKKGVDPKFWGWACALAAQRTILKLDGAFDPALAVKIVMEAAAPMSHIDPTGIAL